MELDHNQNEDSGSTKDRHRLEVDERGKYSRNDLTATGTIVRRKGFRVFVSAVCDTIYSIYLFLCTRTADPKFPKPFRCTHCM